MWLGELITEYGVGNGVSLIIFTGIIAQLPGALFGYGSEGASNVFHIVEMAVIALAATAGIIYVQQAQRKVPMQSAQRVLNPRTGMASAGGRRNFLPLRVNTAGVIPIIFAISIMAFPTIFANFFGSATGWLSTASTWIRINWQPNGGTLPLDLLYNGIEFILILGFTYFYTAVVFDPNDVADNLKKSSNVHPRHPARAPDGRVPGQGHGPDHPGRRASSWPASPWCSRSPPAS